MSYEQLKKLRPALFKRYCGVKPHMSPKMVEVYAKHLQQSRRKRWRCSSVIETGVAIFLFAML